MASNDTDDAKLHDTAFFGHPRGLSTLFFTEMWERFSYYGMRAFLVLYMTAEVAKGGLGYGVARAGLVYGMYTSSVYLMSVPGGWIADRFLGLRRAVLLGGILIMAGHVSLAMPLEGSFYVGLGLVVLGTGLLKPNISAIVGQLYGANDPRRDAGYSIYYMGINIGALVAPIACGFLAQSSTFQGWLSSAGIDPNSAWHFGFGAAAVGMFFGLVQYWLGSRHLGDAGGPPAPRETAAAKKRDRLILVAVLIGTFGVPILFGVLMAKGVIANKEDLEHAFTYLLLSLTVALFAALYLWGCEDSEERRRLTVILVLFLGAVTFWAAFEQAGSTLNLFAQEHTRNELLGIGFPASYFQSINSVCVILLAPVFAALWVYLGKRGKEPSSPIKFGIAQFLVALGFAVLIPAAITLDGPQTAFAALKGPFQHVLVSPGWLVALYFIHTAAEMCLSPVGLSSMSKLAPKRIGGLVMGIWFLAASWGNFLAGKAVGYTVTATYQSFFTGMIIFPVIMGMVLLVLAGPIRRMMSRNAAGGLPKATARKK
ncbi:MAG: MFS transporter [Kofleriaceae bacterium]|nr:oligopeptide:H+ symporter [Myxococcales bacterium]MCB9559150.1 MFS transporter [Kofleriaceae bacterium]MCB9575060.1 MFS transporter [Kofleriaceae bacterium]